MKDITEAALALFTFKKGYTVYPRWLEIAYGIMAWASVSNVLLVIWRAL